MAKTHRIFWGFVMEVEFILLPERKLKLNKNSIYREKDIRGAKEEKNLLIFFVRR